MKVSSGKYGGRKLLDNPFSHIRPTADMVKQAMFNKLGEQTIGARVLDLFCGTGALGIEALSRGASEVVFVDKDKNSINLTKNNLQKLNISAKVIQMQHDAAIKSFNTTFDIIILDPPYQAGLYEETLQLISKTGVLAKDGIIVCEHEKNVEIDFAPFMLISQKNYGIKVLSFLKNSTD